MIKLLEKYLGRIFLSKATGNSSKILLKMNSFTNIFQRFQTADLTLLLYKTAIFKNTFFEVLCSAGIYLLKFNRIDKYNVQSLQQRHQNDVICRRFVVFNVNFEQILHLVLVFLLLSLSSLMPDGYKVR